MSKKVGSHSSVLNALCFVGRSVMDDKELQDAFRGSLVTELEGIYDELVDRWSSEFEYVAPWKSQVRSNSLEIGSIAACKRNSLS